MRDSSIRTALGYLHTVYAAILVVFFAFIGTTLILPFGLLPRGDRERWASPVVRSFAWICVYIILMARPEIYGKEKLPRKRGYLVVCNHRSWLDVVLLLLATDSVGISKKEIARIPFFGLGGRIAGAIYFDRKNRASRGRVVSEAVSMMSRSANIHVFPEGTRTRNGRLSERVHLRLIEEAWKNHIPVVPACVWDTERTLPSGKLVVYGGRKAGLEIGAPLNPRDFPDATSYGKALWEQVRQMASVHGADQEWGE